MAGRWALRTLFWGTAWAIGGCLVLALSGSSLRAIEDEKAPAPAGLPPELMALVAAHNRERAAAKLEPLVPNANLSAAALLHARDMAEHEKMDHVGSDDSKFNERIVREGYEGRRLGENISYGQKTVAEVMREWMNSPHHRDNILGKFSEIGVAYATSASGQRYWCTTFGLSRTKLDPDEAIAGLVAAVNRARMDAGKPAMKVSPKLTSAAQKVAETLAKLGDLHKGDSSYAAVAREAGYGYRLLGEAAASGQPTGEEAVKGWLDEPIHRENFLGRFTEIGAGYAVSKEQLPFWMVFMAEPAPKKKK